MGAMGQARLDWALAQVKDIVHAAELRAMNPTNKIVMITLAVFGFSRGATLARAFVRDLLKGPCEQRGVALVWRQGGHPLEISFMGLWDTVAAVGVPIGASNLARLRTERFSWGNLARAAVPGASLLTLKATDLAFGSPGADPTGQGSDGHQAWADGLDIPGVVQACVHMVAAHEIRNSFPVDSVARGGRKPANCKELVYPGVHSDVGGGYRPGEGGRGKAQPMDTVAVADADKVLSLIPLKAMYDEALLAGVPLRKMGSKDWMRDNVDDFDTNPNMQAAFDHYMDTVGRGARPLGAAIVAHMRLYFAWRFHHIHQKMALRPQIDKTTPLSLTPEERSIAANEKVWAQDQAQLQAELARVQARRQALAAQQMNEQLALARSSQAVDAKTLLPTPQGQAQARAIHAKYAPQLAQLDAEAEALTARINTLPSQGSLIAGLATYDQQLMQDARAIAATIAASPAKRGELRPHYQALMEAYENEFVRRRGLNPGYAPDQATIAFFDRYVHDSLADFQLDSTLPSDPRVVYVGGDEKAKYAQGASQDSAAA
jgi:hypothetical protein